MKRRNCLITLLNLPTIVRTPTSPDLWTVPPFVMKDSAISAVKLNLCVGNTRTLGKTKLKLL